MLKNLKICGSSFSKKINDVAFRIKCIEKAEVVSVFISAIVSAIIEFFRQSLLILMETNFLIDGTFVHALHERRLSILHSIFNIFLITAIVWCITGIISMLKAGNSSKSQWFSLIVFLMFTFSVAWYSCELIIALNRIKFIITTIIVVLLYLLLFLFFSHKRKTNHKDKTNDYMVAAIPPEESKN